MNSSWRINESDLQQVIRYLQPEIREGRRNVGALKLSKLMQLDRFEEDLNISCVWLYPPKVSPTSVPAQTSASHQEDQAGRERDLQILAHFRAEHGW